MKAIIYAGVVLFGAASVYGITDYYKASHKGQLEKLYKEEPAPASNPVTDNQTPTGSLVTPVAEKSNTVKENSAKKMTAKKNTPVKREINLDEFSRARIPEPIEEINTELQEKRPEVKISAGAAATTPAAATEEVKKPDLPKISSKMFSRAPLRTEPVKNKKE